MTDLRHSDAGLIRTVSPNDEMFEGGEDHYFAVGRAVLDIVARSLDAAQRPVAGVRRVLDLPCGHGRILRHLQAAFPEAEITACDLNRDGVDFCAATFGAVPVYSREDPAEIPLARGAFDLIVAVSLFTHFDADLWPGFLDLFSACLRPGGVLFFTTNGRYACAHPVRGFGDARTASLRETYERTGFGYAQYPTPQISTRYGVALSEPAWVFRQLARLKELRVVHFAEHGQDIFACVRDPYWPAQHPPIPGPRQ